MSQMHHIPKSTKDEDALVLLVPLVLLALSS
jgi:hypothetical protein